MAWQSGGGGGYPGVTSDGAGGITFPGAIQAGSSQDPLVPPFHNIRGNAAFRDVPGNEMDSDDVVSVVQTQDVLVGSNAVWVFRVVRAGNITAKDYVMPAVFIQDQTASAQPVFAVEKGGVTVLELKARQVITGALSAVTDPAAKAVLTSLVAAAVGIKVATNSTT